MVYSFALSGLSLLLLGSHVFSSPVVTPSVILPSCPALNGFNYTTPTGTYVVQCSIIYSGPNLPGTHTTPTFQICLDECAANSRCKAVNYFDKSTKCYLKSSLGSSKPRQGVTAAALLSGPPALPPPIVISSLPSSSTSLSQSTSASSVISISSAAPVTDSIQELAGAAASAATPISCPSSDNTFYSTSLNTFLIQCYTVLNVGANFPGTKVTSTFEDCLDQCSAISGCKAIAWLPKSGKCYLKRATGNSKITKISWAAVWVSGPSVPSIASSSSSSSSSSILSIAPTSIAASSSTSSVQAMSLAVSSPQVSVHSTTVSGLLSSSTATSTLSTLLLTSSDDASPASSTVIPLETSSMPTSDIGSSSAGSSLSTPLSSVSESSPAAAASTSQTTNTYEPTGSESQFSGPTTIPGPPPALLGPIAPFDTDMGSLDIITPSTVAGLFYGGSAPSNSSNSTDSFNSTNSGTVAKLSISFQYQSVVLDHSIYITASCSGGQLIAVFSTTDSFNQAKATWPSGVSFLLITADPSCGDGTQNSFWLATSVVFSTGSKTATAPGSTVDLADIFDDMGVDFGTIPSNGTGKTNATTPAYVCGSPSSTTVDGLQAVPCGENFDRTLDDALGYYSGADADLPSIVTQIAPGVVSSVLHRRLFGISLKSVVNTVLAPAVKAITGTVAVLVAPIAAKLPASVTSAISSVSSVVKSVAGAVIDKAMDLLTGSFSKTIALPINLTPPASMLSPSPWGQQFKFFDFALSKADPSYAAAGATLATLKSSLVGSPNPSPGVQIFCVDCGVTGQLQGTGTIGISATKGFYQGSLALTGNLQAGLHIGVNGFAHWSGSKDITILNAGLPGFSIPNIITIGPSVTFGLQSTLTFDALGQILVGTTYSWPALNAVLDVIDSTKSTRSGFTPTVQKTFQAYGDVKATAHMALPISIGFGLNVLSGKFVKSVSLNNVPSLDVVAELFVSAGTGTPANPTGCNGVSWSVSAKDTMDLTVTDLVNYNLFTWQNPPLGGCIGRKIPVVIPPVVDPTPPSTPTIVTEISIPAPSITADVPVVYIPTTTLNPPSTSSPPVIIPAAPKCFGSSKLPAGLVSGTVLDNNGIPYVIVSGAMMALNDGYNDFGSAPMGNMDQCLVWCRSWGPFCKFAVFNPEGGQSCHLLREAALISAAHPMQAYAMSQYSGDVSKLAQPCPEVVSTTALPSKTSSQIVASPSPSVSYCPVPTGPPSTLGCYYGSLFTSPFDPKGELVTTSADSAIVSVEGCQSYCASLSTPFQVIGMTPGYCFCHTSSVLNTQHKFPDSQCSYICPNNPYESCGGVGDQQTFEYTTVYAVQPTADGCVPAPVPAEIVSPAPFNCFNGYHDGKMYRAANGNVYQIRCHVYPSGDDMMNYQTLPSSDVCIKICSTTPGCVAVAWVESSGACFFKSVRRTLPAPISDAGQGINMVVLVSAPLCSAMTCPQNDGVYCSSQGIIFALSCYSSYVTPPLGASQVATLGACADICTKTYPEACHGVTFIPGATVANCLPFSIPNNPDPLGATIVGGISLVDIAMLNRGYGPHPLSLSTTPTSMQMPQAISCTDWVHDGASYTAQNGMGYKISCHADHLGGDMSNAQVPDFPACIQQCSVLAGCIGVAWVPSRTFANCNFKSSRLALPPLVPDTTLPKYVEVSLAMMVSAPSCHSLTCPQDSGRYCSPNGVGQELFEISCNTVYATEYFSGEVAPDLATCIDICTTKYPGQCHAVEWYKPQYKGATTCLLVSLLSNPNPAGDLNGGISAIGMTGLREGYGPVSLKNRGIKAPVVVNIKARVPLVSSSMISSSTYSFNTSSSVTTSSSSQSTSLYTSTFGTTSSSFVLSSSTATTADLVPSSVTDQAISVASTTSFSSYSSSATYTSAIASSTSLSPSNTTDTFNTTTSTVTDITHKLGLNAGADGNLFVSVLTNGTSPSNSSSLTNTFSFLSNSLIADSQARLLHYYPTTMSAVGVSRLRVAEWGKIPLTAALISLVPFSDGNGHDVLVGLDTLGNYYWLFVCTIQGIGKEGGNKVFLAKDATYGAGLLQDPALKFIVTGGVVNDCAGLALIEGAIF